MFHRDKEKAGWFRQDSNGQLGIQTNSKKKCRIPCTNNQQGNWCTMNLIDRALLGNYQGYTILGERHMHSTYQENIESPKRNQLGIQIQPDKICNLMHWHHLHMEDNNRKDME